LDKVEPQATVADIKNLFSKAHPQWYPARQSLRLDPIAARGHHGHALLPGPGGADQLGHGVPDGVRGSPAHLPALLFPGPVPVRAPLRLHRQPAPRGPVRGDSGDGGQRGQWGQQGQ
uniref:TECR-like N-terminal domain-containing protein n=1 Tax=Cyanistes caeruleus TaxID=156563 RepID=A0A8C0ULX4_CYACU